MKPAALAKGLIACILLLGAILAAEYYTKIDIRLQNLFYRPDVKMWMIDPFWHKKLTWFFYKGPKIVYAAVCAGLLGCLCLSWKNKKRRGRNCRMMILLLSLIFVPALVAGAKYYTNVYCPYQLNIYNGIYPFVRILEAYPENFSPLKAGRCFPAGHATVGFAFMALYFCFERRRNQIAGLVFGVLLGMVASVYQMLRGQHFLSHSLFSMVASFMVILIINYAVRRFFCLKKQDKGLQKRKKMVGKSSS